MEFFGIQNIIREIYEPARLEKALQSLASHLSSYLTESISSSEPTRIWNSPELLLAKAKGFLDSAPSSLAEAPSTDEVLSKLNLLSQSFLQTTNHLFSPRYMGHQVCPPIPLAALFEVLASVSNASTAVFEMGPFSNATERALIEKMGGLIGWEKGSFDGIATHGGSLANLTALLTARNIRYADSWKTGGFNSSAPTLKPAIVTSSDTHYSVARAAGILGLGTDQVISTPIDAERRLCPKKLVETLDRAKNGGHDVFCVVASDSTTSTGSFDPIDQIAQIVKPRGIWLHVDAAHGGGLLLSQKHRDKLKGIKEADSVTWDAHKMMFVPSLCTFLFYARRADSYQTFHQDAPYLFDIESNPSVDFDGGLRTVECTRRSLTLGLWAAWATYGEALFEGLVDTTIELARKFHTLLEASEDFEPLHFPQCNILCFRHVPKAYRGASEESISALQTALRKGLVEKGDFYITSTQLDGRAVLRVTLMNPLTQPQHLSALMDHLRSLAAELTRP